MELDDFKKIDLTSSGNLNPENLEEKFDSINGRIREVLTRHDKMKKLFIIFLLSFSIIYLSLMSLSGERTGLSLLILGFISGAGYLYFRYRPLPDTIYTLPVREFIGVAWKRLRYFSRIDWIVIIPILAILGIGGGIHLVSRLSRYTEKTWIVILVWVLFYICLCIFGFFAGKKEWKKESGKLFDEVSKIKESLSMGE